jgi:acyl-[acyl-carrier-protein]-phospholipid O-acyltransferase/long-chain-fatty-acid--[acyl-carrier-protein] ligase
MALAGIGIVLGSIIAAKLSKYYINIGLSVIGSIAITIVVFLIPLIKSMSVMAFIFLIALLQ